MRKKRKLRSRPLIQCGICKFIVESRLLQSELIMVNHHPDTGDTMTDAQIGCIGSKFPRMAKLVLALTGAAM